MERQSANALRVLAQVVTEFSSSGDPRTAAMKVLIGCLRATGADRGRIYFFDLSTANFVSIVHVGRTATSRPIKHPSVDGLSRQHKPIERAILERNPQFISQSMLPSDNNHRYASRVIVPVMRTPKTCVGVIDLDSRNAQHFTDDPTSPIDDLRPFAGLARSIYDWRFRRRVLEEAQQPISYESGEREFYEDTMALVALASQMEFAALREHYEDTDTLHTLAYYGFQGLSSRKELDLTNVSHIPAFRTALTTQKPYIATTLRNAENEKLREMSVLASVRSFIACPLLVGNTVFGVLSFASSVEYEYSAEEIEGLQTVANGIGVSIANYRNFHRAKMDATALAEVGTAISGVEVAQAVRHEARGVLSDAVESTVVLRNALRRKAPDVATALDAAESIDGSLDELRDALDKIKNAVKVPVRAMTTVDLREIWEEAKSQLSGRLTATYVRSSNYEGPNASIIAAPDWFRQIFINLILNSTDAFAGGSVARATRRISLRVNRAEEKSSTIEIFYTDNAGGINFAALRSLDGVPITKDPRAAIFDSNITSKRDGSGWGLALARRILHHHNGSIELVDHRGGVTFRIILPKITT